MGWTLSINSIVDMVKASPMAKDPVSPKWRSTAENMSINSSRCCRTSQRLSLWINYFIYFYYLCLLLYPLALSCFKTFLPAPIHSHNLPLSCMAANFALHARRRLFCCSSLVSVFVLARLARATPAETLTNGRLLLFGTSFGPNKT